MSSAQLTLITKPDCHLCEVAKDVVGDVIASLPDESTTPSVVLEELSILDDAALYEQYWEQIPVLLLNGRQLDRWRIDAVRLRTALLEA